MTQFLYALPSNEVFTERLALAVNGDVGALCVRDFPDGETLVRADTNPQDGEAVIVASLRHPNCLLTPLLFLADALHDMHAARVGLVAPYLAYMRQDARFHDGEAITSRTFAQLLSSHVDWLATVDPHLHRYPSLDAIYTIPTRVVHAAPLIGAWIADHVPDAWIVGPDEESAQWAQEIATAAHAPLTVLTKVRQGDAEVIETIPDLEAHRGRTPVLVDDIISTGRTMIAALEHLREHDAPAAVCVAVHGLFAQGAYTAMKSAGAERIVTTNTIPHPTNGIDIVPLLAESLGSR